MVEPVPGSVRLSLFCSPDDVRDQRERDHGQHPDSRSRASDGGCRSHRPGRAGQSYRSRVSLPLRGFGGFASPTVMHTQAKGDEMKIVVIGGTGLIGSKLVDEAARGRPRAARGVAGHGRRHHHRRGTGRSARGRPGRRRRVERARLGRRGGAGLLPDLSAQHPRRRDRRRRRATTSRCRSSAPTGCRTAATSARKLAQEEAIKAAADPLHDPPRDAVLRVHRPHRRFEHRRRDGSRCRPCSSSPRRPMTSPPPWPMSPRARR